MRPLECDTFFLDNFISDLDEFKDHYESLYGVPIKSIKEDPEYYYKMDVHNEIEPEVEPIKKKVSKPKQFKKLKPQKFDRGEKPKKKKGNNATGGFLI